MLDASTPHDVLATTLAAAFPTWEARSALAREAGLGDVQLTGDATAVWRDLVDEGAQRGRLEALLRAADTRRPGWRRARWLRYAPLAAVLAVLAVAPLAYRLVVPADVDAPVDAAPAAAAVSPDEAAPPDASPELAAPANVPGQAAPVAAPEQAAPAVQSPEQPAPAVQAPAAAPVVQAPAVAPPTDRKPATAPPAAPAPGSCAGKTGWAYLGTTTDVVASEAWTLTRSYNVRTDYPRRDNHYAMAPTICVLHPGDVVAVPDGPQPVDGGAFWIRIQGR